MSKVFILSEIKEGKIKQSSLEIVSASQKAGNETIALVLGNNSATASAELFHAGAKKVYYCEDALLKIYSPEIFQKTALSLIKKENPEIILAAHTPTGKDLLPRIAIELGTGCAADCSSLKFEGNKISVKKPLYAGKALVEIEFCGSGPICATLRPNSLGNPEINTTLSGNAESCNIEGASESKIKLIDLVKGTSERPDVTEASTVISGGRSLKSAENFALLESCADVLGAAVGASRAAVDAGFRPHRDQVGQTGKVVSPSLYIACGISGAIQHLAGMRTSKTIVAINTDPEAPIFQVADYGIVGDLFTLVPLLTEELKKLK